MSDALLRVLLYNTHVADLTQATSRGGEHHLTYQDTEVTTPLSLSMPPTGSTYGRRTVEPFLLGLLPDNQRTLTELGRRFGVSGRNPFALLQHIGLDCAGAVQFVRPEDLPDALTQTGDLEPLSETDIGDRLRQLRAQPTGWVAKGEHWSLAGVQEKFALRAVDGSWFKATGAEPTTHIVKPGIADHRSQALNEHLCLDALHRLGLPAVQSRYLEFDGEPAIVVDRYDRAMSADGGVLRIHQEDMCQALSVYPHSKYESEGGPNAVRIIDLLRDAAADAGSVDRFVDALIVNALLGAPDAHAKNYSVLLVAGRVRLAPLYDVASSLPYEADRGSALRRTAMKIGGENEFGRIEARHWVRFARRARLDSDGVLARVADLASRLPDALSDAITAAGAPAVEIGPRLLDPVAEICESVRSEVPDAPATSSAAGADDGTVAGGEPPTGRWVQPHTRNGRRVEGHWRTLPDR